MAIIAFYTQKFMAGKIYDILINNGIKHNIDDELAVHIRVANFIAVLYVIFTIPFILINMQDIKVLLIRSLSILPGLLAWLLIRAGWHKLGRFTVAITFPVIIYFLGCLLLITDGNHGFAPKMWILASAALPFLVFEYDEWPYITAALFLDLFLLLSFDKVNAMIDMPGLTQNLDRPQMRMIATLGSFLLISAAIFYVKKQLFDRSNELDEKNKELAETINELKTTEEELKQANSELEAVNDDLNSKKHALETAYNNLTSSINYAQTIQKAALFPRLSILEQYLDDYFLIFKPRDVVSGDFVVVEELSNGLAIAVGDATGHGVPGALMSMLGLSTVDNVLHKTKLKTTAEKLDFARKIIINTLNQSKHTSKDGFDLALLIYDFEKQIIQFSGANISLYRYFEGKIIRYKAERIPIGYYPVEKEFTTYEIPVHKGDIFYIFTDGFVDQLGGPLYEKFGTRQLVQVLEKLATLPMKQQKQILEEVFNLWIQDRKQIDDITVLGFKL